MLVLTFTPAEVWRAPVNDAVYTGFDPNLMYASSGGGGRVDITQGSTKLSAKPGSNPSINLATTPLSKLTTALTIEVAPSQDTAAPFRIGIWSPRSQAGYFVVFESGAQPIVSTESLAQGGAGATLIRGTLLHRTVLGHYSPGSPYRVSLLIDKTSGKLTAAVSGPELGAVSDTVTAAAFPELVTSVRLSVTASAASDSSANEAVMSDYQLTIPHQRFWAAKVADQIPQAALVVLAILGAALIVLSIASTLASGAARGIGRRARAAIGGYRRPLALLGIGSAIYIVGNALLFPLGGHPFDMGNEKLYAYVARAYGLDQLYFLPNVASLAKIWGGAPYSESGFPYEPVLAYISAGAGWLNSLLFASGGVLALDSNRAEYVIKAINVVFGLADAVLIYLILRHLQVGERWSLIGSALFLFNPAVWFSMSVWGQTHVISIFFVLAAILLAEKGFAVWAWVALAAGTLTRPQMLVFSLLLGIVLIRKFSWRKNVVAISWTIVVVFLAMLPFTLPTSPSLPVDIMFNNIHVQETGGNEAVLTTVSQDAYSVWPLVTYVFHGASGLSRAFTPSSADLIGSLTYQRASQILTIGALLLLAGVLVVRKRRDIDSGGYIPLVALGITSFLMLLTGVVATHFLLALPFLLLCRKWMGPVAYLYVAAIWTVTTLVPMYGDMGVVISSQDYPLLAADHNPITQFVVTLYSWDRFITVGVVGNICAVIWLAFYARSSVANPTVAAARPVSLTGVS